MAQDVIEEQQVATPEAVVAESESRERDAPEASAGPEVSRESGPEAQPTPAPTADTTESPTQTTTTEPAPIQAPQSLPGDLERIQQAEARATAAEQRVQQADLDAADQQAHTHFLTDAQREQSEQIAAGTDEQVATNAANRLYRAGMAEWGAFKSQQQVESQVPLLQQRMGERVSTVLAAAEQHGIKPLELFNATKQMDGTLIAGEAARMAEMTKMRAEIAQLKTGQANTAVPPNQTFATTNGIGTLGADAFTNWMADPANTPNEADYKRWNDMGQSG